MSLYSHCSPLFIQELHWRTLDNYGQPIYAGQYTCFYQTHTKICRINYVGEKYSSICLRHQSLLLVRAVLPDLSKCLYFLVQSKRCPEL